LAWGFGLDEWIQVCLARYINLEDVTGATKATFPT